MTRRMRIAMIAVLLLWPALLWAQGNSTPPSGIKTLNAGAGLTGGGTTPTVTLNAGAGLGITVNADDIAIDPTYTQRRVTGTCTSPNGITAVAQDGTVTCATGVLNTSNVSGTANTVAKFTAPNFVGNSLLTDDATTLSYNVGKFTVAAATGNGAFAGTLTADTGLRVFDVAGTGLASSSNTISLAAIANNTVLGNNSGISAAPTALTGTQVTALLDTFTTTLKGLVPSPGTSTGTKFLSDAGTWTTPPGTGLTGTGTTGDIAAWSSSSALGNYAGSTATACGAGNATTNIAIGANGALTNTCSSLSTLGAAAGTGTLNMLTRWSNTTGGLVDSHVSDNGTTLTVTDSDFTMSTAGTDTFSFGNGASDQMNIVGALAISGANATQLTTVTNAMIGLDTGTTAKVLNVGRDISLTTNAQNGLALTAYSNGNNYIDSKTWTSGSTIFRVGQGAVAGNVTTWLTVTNSNGAASFGNTVTATGTITSTGGSLNATNVNSALNLGDQSTDYLSLRPTTTGNWIQSGATSTSGSALPLYFGPINATQQWAWFDASGDYYASNYTDTLGGAYAGTVQDFADEMNVGHVRKNWSLNSDALGTDVVNPNVGWFHQNYTPTGSTLVYTTSTQVSPRGISETVGQLTCTDGTATCTSGGSDYRMIDTSTSTAIADLRSQTVTISLWVKMASGGPNSSFGVSLARYQDNDTGGNFCTVNSTTWTRCTYTRTFSATSYTDNSELRAYISPHSTIAHYIYGAQVELHNGATPYQRTDAVLDSGATSTTLALAASMGRFGLYEQDPDVAIRMFDASANYYGVLAKAPATGISVCREDGTCTASAASTAVYGKTLGTGATAIYGDATAGGAAGYFAGDVTITSGHTLHVPTVTNDTGSVLTIGTSEQISITTSSNFTSGITVNETGFGNATFEATGGGNTIIAGGGTGATQISSGSGGITLSSNTTISGSATLTTSSGLTTIGAGGLISTAGANTLGENEYSMATTSNSSGTLTDASFARTARGVWWTWTGGGTLDGFGFTSGVPIDGQKFLICVIGGGALTLNSENTSEPTAGRRFNFITSSLVIRSGACRDLTYDGSVGGTSRWRVDNYLTPQVTMVANAIPKMGAGVEVLASSLTDNGTTVATSEAITGGVITGTKIVGTGASGANTVQGSFVSTAQTQNVGAGIFQNTGSFDTTAAVRTAFGMQATSSATVSAGANTLTDEAGSFSATGTTGVANIGIYATASGGTVSNTAIWTDAGDIKLGQTSGNFAFGTANTQTFAASGTSSFCTACVNQTQFSASNTVIQAGATAGTISIGSSNTGGITIGQATNALSLSSAAVTMGTASSTVHVTVKDSSARPTTTNCGTTTVVGNDTAGFFTMGTGTNSCTLTFNTSFGSNVDCNVWAMNAAAPYTLGNFSVGTTGVSSIQAPSANPVASGVKVHWLCHDH